MIPGKIATFLEHHANTGLAGARDRHLVPFGNRISGWRLAPDGRTFTVLIPPLFLDRLIEALEDNGQLAMTFEEHPTHETYQLKGRYLRHRPIEPGDLAIVTAMRERLGRTMRGLLPPGIDESYVLGLMVPQPGVAIDIDVREVYLQTPGPGAGGRLYPPPDEYPEAQSLKPDAR